MYHIINRLLMLNRLYELDFNQKSQLTSYFELLLAMTVPFWLRKCGRMNVTEGEHAKVVQHLLDRHLVRGGAQHVHYRLTGLELRDIRAQAERHNLGGVNPDLIPRRYIELFGENNAVRHVLAERNRHNIENSQRDNASEENVQSNTKELTEYRALILTWCIFGRRATGLYQLYEAFYYKKAGSKGAFCADWCNMPQNNFTQWPNRINDLASEISALDDQVLISIGKDLKKLREDPESLLNVNLINFFDQDQIANSDILFKELKRLDSHTSKFGITEASKAYNKFLFLIQQKADPDTLDEISQGTIDVDEPRIQHLIKWYVSLPPDHKEKEKGVDLRKFISDLLQEKCNHQIKQLDEYREQLDEYRDHLRAWCIFGRRVPGLYELYQAFYQGHGLNGDFCADLCNMPQNIFSQWQTRLEILISEIFAWQEKLKIFAWQEKLKILNETKSKPQKDQESLNSKISAWQEKLESLNSEISAWQDELEASTRQQELKIPSWQINLKSLISEISAWQEKLEIPALRKKLEPINSKTSKWQDALESLISKIFAWREKLELSYSETSAWQDELEIPVWQEKLETLNSEISSWQKELEPPAWREKLKPLISQASKWNNKLRILNDQLAQLARLDSEISKLKDHALIAFGTSLKALIEETDSTESSYSIDVFKRDDILKTLTENLKPSTKKAKSTKTSKPIDISDQSLTKELLHLASLSDNLGKSETSDSFKEFVFLTQQKEDISEGTITVDEPRIQRLIEWYMSLPANHPEKEEGIDLRKFIADILNGKYSHQTDQGGQTGVKAWSDTERKKFLHSVQRNFPLHYRCYSYLEKLIESSTSLNDCFPLFDQSFDYTELLEDENFPRRKEKVINRLDRWREVSFSFTNSEAEPTEFDAPIQAFDSGYLSLKDIEASLNAIDDAEVSKQPEVLKRAIFSILLDELQRLMIMWFQFKEAKRPWVFPNVQIEIRHNENRFLDNQYD